MVDSKGGRHYNTSVSLEFYWKEFGYGNVLMQRHKLRSCMEGW
jgi:hypothetical protein